MLQGLIALFSHGHYDHINLLEKKSFVYIVKKKIISFFLYQMVVYSYKFFLDMISKKNYGKC